jgi:hypothetical protein
MNKDGRLPDILRKSGSYYPCPGRHRSTLIEIPIKERFPETESYTCQSCSKMIKLKDLFGHEENECRY